MGPGTWTGNGARISLYITGANVLRDTASRRGLRRTDMSPTVASGLVHIAQLPSISAGAPPMTDPCDLSAVVARRLIGAKRLAPSELLASCIGRIEAVDHAVNGIPARDFDRARAAARRADEAVAHGDDLPALHGLPIGIKDLEETQGLVTAKGSVIYKDSI